MNYKLEQFKEWLAQSANHPRDLTDWETVYNQLGNEFTEESLANLTDLADLADYQEIIREWINSLENEEQRASQSSPMPGGFPLEEESATTIKRARSFDNLRKKPKEEPITTDLTKELSKKVREKQKLISQLQKQNKALQILANHRLELLEQEKTALIALAKQKIRNKKEALELLEQLEEKFAEKEEELISKHQEEKEQLQALSSQEKTELLTSHQEEIKRWRERTRDAYDLWQRHEKAAEYLKDKLNSTERTLEETKQELTEAEEQIQQQEQDHAEVFEAKEQELTNKQEIITVLQQRNADLQQTKLPTRDQEISRLKDWISKLESASAQGNAWEQLQAELKQNQQTITNLQEQLSLKYPNKYYWVYALVFIVIIYLALK